MLIRILRFYRKQEINQSNVLTLILYLILIGLPLLRQKYDMWDGTIISYSLETNDLEGLKKWFNDSNWELQYFYLIFQNLIAVHLGVSYLTVSKSFTLLLLWALFKQVNWIAGVCFNFSKKQLYFSKILIILLPIWHVLHSSVLSYQIFLITLGLFGIRIYLLNIRVINYIGIAFCSISYQLNSLLLFLPVLCFICALNVKNWVFEKKLFKLALYLLIIGLFYFMYMRLFNTKEGLYQNYNEFKVSLSYISFQEMSLNLLKFSTILIFPLMFFIWNSFRIMIVTRDKSFFSFLKKYQSKLFFSFFTLFIISIAPYVLVGKSAHTLDESWGSRYLFLASIPITWLCAIAFSFNNKTMSAKSFTSRIIINSKLIIIFLLIMSLSVFQTYSKVNRDIFTEKLIQELVIQNYEIPPGRVAFFGKSIPKPIFSEGYEANYVLFKAYSKILWWTRIQEEKTQVFMIPEWVNNYPPSFTLFRNFGENCLTSIEIQSEKYSSMKEIFLGAANSQTVSTIRVLSKTVDCTHN
jgi:hypothetical protein